MKKYLRLITYIVPYGLAFFLTIIVSLNLASAQIKAPNLVWSHLDLKQDTTFGVSKIQAYLYLKEQIAKPIIIAVIDGGADITHPALKNNIWTNSHEIPGNGKDDDDNGYIDDIHGWNFLGSKNGSFLYDNTDMVRNLRSAMKNNSKSNESQRLQSELQYKRKIVHNKVSMLKQEKEALDRILSKFKDTRLSESKFRNYHYQTHIEENVIISIVNAYKNHSDVFALKKEMESRYDNYLEQLQYFYNINYDPRRGDEFKKRGYGNPDVNGINPYHGTHVTGIIVGNDTNGTVPGIANNAKIMVLRAVGKGEFFDKDVALAIRYAADNGARIINMSVGKSTTRDALLIEEAVKYAMSKDVLIVHACGNEGKKLGAMQIYPNKKYSKGGEAESWIEVGASSYKNDERLICAVSNYGRDYVDIFAPGQNIYSCIPGGGYGYLTGTSMAAPLVSGIAATLMGYFPNLNSIEIKDAIMSSVVKVDHDVNTGFGEIIPFEDSCRSGGVINLLNAVQSLSKKFTGYLNEEQ